jgi:hypothetical protein
VRRVVFCVLGFAVFSAASLRASESERTELGVLQTRAATVEEISALQTIGRVVITPNGKFVIYEWQRPYAWVPSARSVDTKAARRLQTTIFKVKIAPKRASSYELSRYGETTSELLIPPSSGSTYYLGSASPDSRYVVVHEFNRVTNSSRTGAVELSNDPAPKVVWFDTPPDQSAMDIAPVWTSKEEFLYRAKAMIVRASVTDASVQPCPQCQLRALPSRELTLAEEDTLAGSTGSLGLPAGAKLLAQSQDNLVSVYLHSTPDVLALMLQLRDDSSDESLVSLFQNPRRPAEISSNR